MTKNILLVEYDEATINIIKELLPPPMFEVAVANDGETAKRKLAGKPFDLMITAAMLPRFHGFNLALAVAQENPSIKIIIISAIYKGFYYKQQATSQYRADDFFEKPLEKKSFKKRVLELLNISVNDFRAVANAATTHVPVFDTAKIPTIAKLEEEEKKLSADDIFGDLIKNIEKVPEFEIDLDNGEAPKESRQPGLAQTVLLKKEPEVVREIKKPDPGKTLIPTPPSDTRQVPESKKPAASSQSINDNLDSLRQTVKKKMPENKMRKIEDDIARRFEDTLSGLGLQSPRPAAQPQSPGEPQVKPVEKPAPKPEAKLEPKPVPPAPEKIIVKEEAKPQAAEVIIPDKASLPQAEVVAPKKKLEEVKEVKEIKTEKKPLLREIPKAQPKTLPVQESKVTPLAKQSPPQPLSSEAELRIDFDEDKSIPVKKKATAAPKEIKKITPLFKEISEEKNKKPSWAIALVLILMAAAALVYFLVLKKSAPAVNQAEAKLAITEKTAAQTQLVQKQPPAVDPQVLAAEKLKQEEELKKLQLAAEENKKLQGEKRVKQAESERLKKEAEDRVKQEELDRLQKEEARKKQDELDRLAKEAQELKKAEDLKEIERKLVKEGDIIPLKDVDKAPVVVSKPAPRIYPNMRTNMAANQTVLFSILINQNGDVETAFLLKKSNNAQLNMVLIATIKTWKYTPAIKNGVRVKVWKTVPLIIEK